MHEKTPKHMLESQLLPRLRILGFILFSFSLIALGWALFYSPYPPPIQELGFVEAVENEIATELPHPSKEVFLNLYAVSAIFAGIGLTCLAIAKKRKQMSDQG